MQNREIEISASQTDLEIWRHYLKDGTSERLRVVSASLSLTRYLPLCLSSLFAHRFWISSNLSGQILGESTARETTIHVVDAPIDSEPSWQLQMAFQRTTTTRSRKIPPNCAQFGV